MEISRNFRVKLNSGFIVWCVCVPVLFFVITLLLAAVFSTDAMDKLSNERSVAEFLSYYKNNSIREFSTIFLNNSFVAIVIIYFTPFALFVRDTWEKRRGMTSPLSSRERLILYSFPVLFLIREAIRIALTVSDLSGQIDRGVIITFFGIIFPHGLPEFLALSVAGAMGMEVTRRCFSSAPGRTPGIKQVSLLIIFIGFCAFLEVHLTPRVFALLLS